MRQYHVITFLRTRSCDDKHDNSIDDIIYEAKVSCLVSGWDCHSWTAHMFIDLYYEESNSDEDLESITAYEKVRQDGLNFDPFTSSETMTNTLRDPREYLLKVLEVRLSKVKNEWENSVLHIERSIEAYVSLHVTPLGIT